MTPMAPTDDDADEENPRFNRTCVPVASVTSAYASGKYDNLLYALNDSTSGLSDLIWEGGQCKCKCSLIRSADI